MKILVVNDEIDVQPLFRQRLRKEIRSNEIELEFEQSGEESVSFIHKNDHDKSLVLSDIIMPRMRASMISGRVKKNHISPTPTIMTISANVGQVHPDKADNLDAEGCFIKSVGFNLCKEKIKALSL